MIWNSIVAMTVIDVIVLVSIGIMVAVALKSRLIGFERNLRIGSLLVLSGALVTGLFYFLDLTSMWVLPYFVGEAEAMTMMRGLHLNLPWIVMLVSILLICSGFAISNWANMRSQAAQAEAEERVRGVAENTTDWIWQVDPKLRNVFSNDQVEKVLGYTRREIASLPMQELLHPDDLADINRRLPEYVAERRGWEGWVLRCRHKDGGTRYLSDSGGPVFDKAGDLAGFHGVSRDISFQVLLADISSGLMATAPESTDERVNQALGQIAACYGLDRASLWWREGFDDVFRRSHVAAYAGMEPAWEQLHTVDGMTWARDSLYRGDHVAIRNIDDLPDDAIVERGHMQSHGVKSLLMIPLIVEKRRMACSVFSTLRHHHEWPAEIQKQLKLLTENLAIALDRNEAIGRTRQREQDLRRSERLALVGSYSFAITGEANVFPPAGRMQSSQQLDQLLGTPLAGVSFATLMSQVHIDDRERVMAAFRDLIENGASLYQEYRIVRPDGTVRYLINHTEIDHDENGNAVRVFGSCKDITDISMALLEIQALKDRLEEENVVLREEIKAAHGFDTIVGHSPVLRECLDQVSAVAGTDVPVLILGETGTGKELVAKAIHDMSRRKDARLVSVNCAALPTDLVESELFGHEKGAFTGAHSRRQGRFEAADGGTLFLDEIGELPLEVQGKLLRALQDGSFERVGGTETLQVDVRLIAATNRRLQRAVDDGEFRADLYYRINTFPIEVPPLRARLEDIPLLAEHFVRKHAERFGKSIDSISTRMLKYLQEHPWPGNVRELEGFIERCLISATGSVLNLPDREMITRPLQEKPSAVRVTNTVNLRDFERNHILEVLDSCQWVIDGDKGAATILGLPPSTLRSKMKRHGIRRGA